MSSGAKLKSARVGVIDSGIAGAVELERLIVAYRDFVGHGESEAVGLADYRDSSGHGTAIGRLILSNSASTTLVIARVFGDVHHINVDRVCGALSWLMNYDVDIVNMSLGTRAYSPVLEQLCRQSVERGTLLICSSPARGGPVFPAAFDRVISVSGDARCAPNEWSWLDTKHAILGANPLLEPGNPEAGGGASYAAARVSGFAANLISQGVERRNVLKALQAQCAYFGREIKSGTFFD